MCDYRVSYNNIHHCVQMRETSVVNEVQIYNMVSFGTLVHLCAATFFGVLRNQLAFGITYSSLLKKKKPIKGF